jgi:hypothetical protein
VRVARAVRAIGITSLPVSFARIEHGQTKQMLTMRAHGYKKKKNALGQETALHGPSSHIAQPIKVNNYPHSGWLDFALKGLNQKHAVFLVPSSGIIARGDGFLKTINVTVKKTAVVFFIPIKLIPSVRQAGFLRGVNCCCRGGRAERCCLRGLPGARCLQENA